MPTNNSSNISSAGIVKYDGTSTFSAVTVTQHDVLIGGSSNGITSVAPSSTSGVPVISQGASADPVFGTCAIAGGGTNATSMSTSTGIVKYDGTSLVTSTTAKIDSSNRMTNTSQPCFLAYKSSVTSNATGDGTLVNPVIFDTVVFDNGSNYNGSTGIFTAPVTGKYLFTGVVTFSGVGTSSNFTATVVGTARSFAQYTTNANTGANNFIYCPFTCILDMTANDTCKITAIAANGTKNIGIEGGAGMSSNLQGHLIC